MREQDFEGAPVEDQASTEHGVASPIHAPKALYCNVAAHPINVGTLA